VRSRVHTVTWQTLTPSSRRTASKMTSNPRKRWNSTSKNNCTSLSRSTASVVGSAYTCGVRENFPSHLSRYFYVMYTESKFRPMARFSLQSEHPQSLFQLIRLGLGLGIALGGDILPSAPIHLSVADASLFCL